MRYFWLAIAADAVRGGSGAIGCRPAARAAATRRSRCMMLHGRLPAARAGDVLFASFVGFRQRAGLALDGRRDHRGGPVAAPW
ncbi:hypothetical protein AWC25_00525 [Mycobacterium sherrisii]|uniref:Uncharacterized protein n=1 Tax=Mycobacterium sherrisii TaxID=243061 RepID=A0A1E3SR08_9MYCO|nr:hypothetical protein BHQ21_17195 [Mycobacterium sherrisii]ORW73234.1 hypothetical protein AWC25_00525 [Mycobacterium sherrisii]